MQNWPLDDGGYRYRPLRRGVKGWDVFGLQSMLLSADYALPKFGADGDYGAETESTVRLFQAQRGLAADGIAGVISQAALCKRVIAFVCGVLPQGLARGQIESESSFWVGNHSPKNAQDGKFDLGLTMLHRLGDVYENKLAAFNGPPRLREFGDFLRMRHDTYYGHKNSKGQTVVDTHEYAWKLASGAWNAPAWTDTLARGGVLKPEQQAHLDGYIERATAYVTEWGD